MRIVFSEINFKCYVRFWVGFFFFFFFWGGGGLGFFGGGCLCLFFMPFLFFEDDVMTVLNSRWGFLYVLMCVRISVIMGQVKHVCVWITILLVYESSSQGQDEVVNTLYPQWSSTFSGVGNHDNCTQLLKVCKMYICMCVCVSGTPGSNPAFSRGTQLVSFRFEYRLPVPEHRN